MKPEPKFVPGELVVIDSKVCPQFNGQQVSIIEAKYGLHQVRSTDGSIKKWCWMYRADVDAPIGRGWWGEKSLHKLPPNTPAQFDASIWQPRKVEA